MATNNDQGRELGWNDSIERDGSDFILLPEGDYDFLVSTFERGRHPGSEKLPPCNKAVLHIEIQAPQGTVEMKHNLFLHTSTEGILSAFFASIGQKKKGEKIQMDWNRVIGATGRCKIGVRPWTGNDGEERQSNEIKKFYPREQPAAQPFQAGRF